MKKHLGILLTIIIATLLSSCTNLKKLEWENCRIISIKPTGLTTMEVELGIKINNPIKDLNFSDIHGVIEYQNNPVINFTSNDLNLKANTNQEYVLNCNLQVSPELSFSKFFSFFSNKMNDKDLTISIYSKLDVIFGIKKGIKIEKVPVVQITKQLKEFTK